MIRLALGILLVATSCSGQMFPFPGNPTAASTPPSVIQSRAGGNDVVTSIAAATASPAYAVGNMLFVRIGSRDDCSVIGAVSVTDDGSTPNTYTQIGSTGNASGLVCQAIFQTTIAHTSTIVTGHFANSARLVSISVVEVANVSSVGQSPSPGTTTNSPVSPAISGNFSAATGILFTGLEVYGGDLFTTNPSGPSCSGGWHKVATDPYGGCGTQFYCILSAPFTGSISAVADSATIVVNNSASLQ